MGKNLLWWLGISFNNLGSNSTDDLGFISSLQNCSQLQFLSLSRNHFGGVLPAAIGNLSTQLSQLYFDNNQLYGTITPALERYINLNVLIMEGNLFTGTNPSYFGNFQKMLVNWKEQTVRTNPLLLRQSHKVNRTVFV